MKAKILISFYPREGGHKCHRAYGEAHYQQAEKDLELVKSADDSSAKSWELQECEIFLPVKNSKTKRHA